MRLYSRPGFGFFVSRRLFRKVLKEYAGLIRIRLSLGEVQSPSLSAGGETPISPVRSVVGLHSAGRSVRLQQLVFAVYAIVRLSGDVIGLIILMQTFSRQ
jgi:hypothetical protein